MRGGQTYLPPCKNLGLGDLVAGLAQQEPADFSTADFSTGTED